MPFKRKYAKRKYKRKPKKKQNALAIYRLPYPAKRKVRLRYTWYANLTTASTGVNLQQFRPHSPYDPDLTGSGGQPRYFDQLCTSTLYKKFLVDKCFYEVKFINKDVSKDALVSVSVRPQTTLAPGNVGEHWMSREQSRTQVRTILPSGDVASRRTIKGMVHMPSLVQQSKTAYEGNNANTGGYGSNPSTTAAVQVIVSDNPQDGIGSNVDVYVMLTYYVTFYDRSDEIAPS